MNKKKNPPQNPSKSVSQNEKCVLKYYKTTLISLV